MKNEISVTQKNWIDRVLVGLAILGILLALLPLVSPEIFEMFFGAKQIQTQTVRLGKITSLKNDIRQKNQNGLTWKELQKESDLYLGDSIFNGENSRSRAELADGSKIDLEQNSLITFSKINEIEIPNLAFGNFKLAVNGKMKIAINGEITEIEGQGAEVEIVLNDKLAPQIKLKKGSAKVSVRGKHHVQLEKEKPQTLDEKKSRKKIAESLQVAPPEFKVGAEFFRKDELYDFYDLVNLELRLRKERRQLVDFATNLELEKVGLEMEHQKLHAELAPEPHFIHVGWLGELKKPTLQIQKSYVGENYVRLSRDGQIWGSAKKYLLTSLPLELKPPELMLLPSTTIRILQDSGQILLKPIYNQNYLSSAIIEVSESESFAPLKTQVFISKTEGTELAITEAKILFVRLRGMNQQGEVTDYSPVTQLRIEKPDWPLAPRLAEKEIQLYEDEERLLKWQGSSTKTSLDFLDANGKKISSRTTKSQEYKISGLSAGQYQLQLFGADRFGRKSKKISSVKINVRKREPILAKKDEVIRKPASTKGESSYVLSEIRPVYLNEHYGDSKISIEGSAFTVYSQQQVNKNQENPTALTVAVHGIHWWSSLGIEGIFKTKLTTLSSSPDGDVAPTQIEGRVHKRWTIGFSPFSRLGSSQISIFSGLEFYRNSASGPFSPKYDLMKLGTALSFPLNRRFDTGGELVYGMGFDQSQKYEVSGYLGYYLDPQLSFGAGYRMHLFNAGSSASAPRSLPYREGFGEGYSVMRWSY